MAMRDVWQWAKASAQRYSGNNGSHLAAGIAFYTLFSILPLALFLVSIFGLVARGNSQLRVADEISDTLNIASDDFTFELDNEAVGALYGPSASEELTVALERLGAAERSDLANQLESGENVTISGRVLGREQITAHGDNAVIETIRGVSRVSGPFAVVSLLLTAWSASALFGAVRRSLNTIWNVETERPFVQQKLLDGAMLLGFGALLMASLVLTGAIAWLRQTGDEAFGWLPETGIVLWPLQFLLPAFFSFVVFAALYRFVLNVTLRLASIWPGALVAALLFELLKNGFSTYVEHFASYDLAYGALGGVLLFMTWTYLSAMILLLGAALSVEYARMRYGAYEDEPAGEPLRWQTRVKRFVRGLFVQDEGERAKAPGPR
jgi:YihY family inner membrane protein